jgi:uncharacterized RDD family membrane protein YckC
LDDNFIVDTPENVEFSYQVAGIGSRFLAALVDSSIIAVAMVVAEFSLWALLSTRWGAALMSRLAGWGVAIFVLVTFAIFWGYYIVFEMAWNGQTPGKRWIGLRVIKVNGYPISLVDSTIRNLVRVVDFLPAYYGLGVIAMFANGQARRLGDFAAGTVVVKERKEVTLESLRAAAAVTAPPAPGRPGGPGDEVLRIPNLERLNSAQLEVVRDYLARRYELSDAEGLARKIADSLAAQLDYDWQAVWPSADRFLTALMADYARHVSP